MKMFMTACAFLVIAGCYVEETPSRAPSPFGGGTQQQIADPKTTRHDKAERVKGECFHGAESGCIEGHISSAMSLSVSGKSFFDADDLASRFHEIVEIKSPDGKVLTDGKDYEVTLVTPFTNRNFAQEFQVFIKGERVETADVRSSGKFFFNELPEGEYDIRIQRPIKMLVKMKQPAGEPVESIDCATIFQDASFEVVQGEKSDPVTFDNMSLYAASVACPK